MKNITDELEGIITPYIQHLEDFIEKDKSFQIDKQLIIEFIKLLTDSEEILDFFAETQVKFEFDIDPILRVENQLKYSIKSEEIFKEISILLRLSYIILTMSKLISTKHMRAFYKEIPSNEEFRDRATHELTEDLNLNEEEFSLIRSKIDCPFDFNRLKEALSIAPLKLVQNDKNFYEHLFYVLFKNIYKSHYTNYWHNYLDFLKLSHKHLGHVFIKSIDFNEQDKFLIERKINYYEKKLTSQLVEIKQQCP